MTSKTFLALIPVVALFATGAFAQADSILKPAFARYDRNDDGVVERREFPGSDRQFEAMDRDGDKKVTYEEYKASPVARSLVESRYRNGSEPRERVAAAALQARRLEMLRRFDADRNGRLTKDEWTGSPLAFQTLDANGDGTIDGRDEREARGNAPPPEPPVPEFERVPDPKAVQKAADRNGDGVIDKREARRAGDIGKAFDWVDQNGDGRVTEEELRRACNAIRQRHEEERRRRGRQKAFRVPFAQWDKNGDDRLDQTEFRERRYLFSRIDLDRDAAITPDEVERYVRSVEGEDFVGRYDLNEDGKVTLVEFGGHPAAFRRADVNGDGVVTRRDR